MIPHVFPLADEEHHAGGSRPLIDPITASSSPRLGATHRRPCHAHAAHQALALVALSFNRGADGGPISGAGQAKALYHSLATLPPFLNPVTLWRRENLIFLSYSILGEVWGGGAVLRPRHAARPWRTSECCAKAWQSRPLPRTFLDTYMLALAAHSYACSCCCCCC
jgi:hypothetical protein